MQRPYAPPLTRPGPTGALSRGELTSAETVEVRCSPAPPFLRPFTCERTEATSDLLPGIRAVPLGGTSHSEVARPSCGRDSSKDPCRAHHSHRGRARPPGRGLTAAMTGRGAAGDRSKRGAYRGAGLSPAQECAGFGSRADPPHGVQSSAEGRPLVAMSSRTAAIPSALSRGSRTPKAKRTWHRYGSSVSRAPRRLMTGVGFYGRMTA